MPTSYNGWPASRDPKAIGINTRWEPIPGHPMPGGVKAGPVEVVMTYFARQLHARVEPIDVGGKDDWGYVYKQSANSPKLVSCHASGTAFDWNASRHPNGKRGTWSKAQVAEVRKIQAEVHGVVHWLLDATGTPDEMHFEIRGSVAQVAAAAAALNKPMPAPVTTEDDMTFIYTPDNRVVLFAGDKLVHIDSPKGIDPDGVNSWDLREDRGTWANMVKAFGPVVAV